MLHIIPISICHTCKSTGIFQYVSSTVYIAPLVYPHSIFTEPDVLEPETGFLPTAALPGYTEKNNHLPEAEIISTNRLALPTTEGVVLIKLSDIVRLEADGNYSIVVLNTGERHCVSRILKDFEAILPCNRFFRPHQSHIIHIDAISMFLRQDGGCVVLADKTRIPVARRRKEAFLEWLCSNSINL